MARDSRPNDTYRDKLSRRKLLKIGGAATLVGTAGCGGDGGGDTTTTTTTEAMTETETETATETETMGEDATETATDTATETEEETAPLRDDTFDNPIGSGNQPTQTHYNPYNPVQNMTGSNAPESAMYDYYFGFNSRLGGWQGIMATGFEVGSDAITLSLRDDYTWNDGDPVTADDVVAQFQIIKALDFPVWDLIDGVTAVDDTTVEFPISGGVNGGVAQNQINRTHYVKADSELGNFAERVQDASSNSEMKSIASDLTSFAYAEGGDPIPKSCGPYKLANVTENEIQLERHDGYPRKTNVRNYNWFFTSSSQERAGAMISGKTDGQTILAAEQQVREKYPDYTRLISLPGFGGTSLLFNHSEPGLENRAFRQATAYLLDNNNIDANSNPRLAPLQQFSLLTDPVAAQWLGDDFEAFTQYGPEGKPDEAERVLQEAGFTKSGGNWLTPDGEAMEFSVKTPPWPAPLGIAQTVADTFSQFGIPTSLQQQEGSTWSADGSNGNFTLYAGYYGGGPHPVFSYQGLLGTKNTAAGVPLEAEIPPVGQPDSSDTITVNVEDHISTIQTQNDQEANQQLVKELAWYVNQVVPKYNATQGTTPSYITVDDWSWGSSNPVEDDRLYYAINQGGAWGSALRQTREGSNRTLLQGKRQG